MTASPADVPLVAECRTADDMPASIAAARAEVDAGRWFAWLFRRPNGTDWTGFIVGAEGALFRIRDADARPLGLFADFRAAVRAGLAHAARVEGAA